MFLIILVKVDDTSGGKFVIMVNMKYYWADESANTKKDFDNTKEETHMTSLAQQIKESIFCSSENG